MATAQHIYETHQDSTPASLKRDIEAFKRECRPAGRGRPSRNGARYFHLNGRTVGSNGHTVGCTIGESCIGAGGWGMTVRLTLDGKQSSLAAILKALAA